MADTLTVIDNRSGKKVELPIEHGAIRAVDLGKLGIVSYDPALLNTATCKSKISYIDGDRGILRYRGYPIEELAEKSTFLETAYLIVKGELPTTSHFRMWQHNIKMHTMVHENLKQFIEGFRYDAHPMGILIGTVGALSTFYPEAKNVMDLESRRVQTRRLIGKMPTIAAFAYRHSRGMPYVYPDNELSYTGNFLSMMYKMTELKYRPDPVLERALDVLFILHADHEQNCSTTTMRTIGSSLADPYASVAGSAAALGGRATARPTRRSCTCCTRSARRTTCRRSSSRRRAGSGGSWASGTASTRTTTRARRSSSRSRTRCSRSPAGTR